MPMDSIIPKTFCGWRPGSKLNPARWFGPALVSDSWGGVWPYLVGPIVGSLLAALVFRFVIEAGGPAPTEPPEMVKSAT